MTSTEQHRPSSFYALDGIRGITALIIAFLHHNVFSSFMSNSHASLSDALGLTAPFGMMLQVIAMYGGIGVDLFFCISGFVFYMNYKDRIANKSISLNEFALFRFSRIYPLHWATLLITILLFIFARLTNSMSALIRSEHYPLFSVSAYNIWEAFTSVFLVQGLWTTSGKAFNPPAWTLTYELLAYLIFFMLCRKSKRENGIIFFIIPIFLGLFLAIRGSSLPLLGGEGTSRVLIAFFSGCLLYNFFVRTRKKHIRRIIAFVSGMVFSGLSYLIIFASNSPLLSGERYLQILQLIWVPSLIMVVLSTKWINWFFSLRFFRWLGALSYSVYLWHFPVLIAIHIVMFINGERDWNVNLIAYAIWIAATLLISHFSCYFFEQPIQKYIRTKYFDSRTSQKPSLE